MGNRSVKRPFSWAVFFFSLFIGFSSSALSGNPETAYYSSSNDRIFWFIHISDIHIGTTGTQDSRNLQWIVTEARNIIYPSFIVASGDLTDSTNGNIFGYPDGPYYQEWNEYRSILNSAGIDANSYYDIPGNHDAYSDRLFSYYRAYSVQGQATGQTQISWTREFGFGKYHFLGINTADNTGNPFSIFFPWGDNAGLDLNELAFIEAALEEHRDADLTMIFGHHPVTDTGYSTDTWLFYGHKQFIDYLDSYGVSLYGYGHTHRAGKKIFPGNNYTGLMQGRGIHYFNIASLGKSSENQYSIIAVDCNGISIITRTVRTWPAVLITAPLDKYFGISINPYVYNVPNSSRNPLRALVFDINAVTAVQYRIDGSGEWNFMNPVPGNAHLWEALWDASGIPEGEHTVEVKATSDSGASTALITVNVIPRIVMPWLQLLLF